MISVTKVFKVKYGSKFCYTKEKKYLQRHSLPIRDLLSDNEQDIFMVDFERTTIRLFHCFPAWR